MSSGLPCVQSAPSSFSPLVQIQMDLDPLGGSVPCRCRCGGLVPNVATQPQQQLVYIVGADGGTSATANGPVADAVLYNVAPVQYP